MRVLVVGTEKELKAFEPVVQAAARKYVGPVRVASAFRAHEAVAAINVSEAPLQNTREGPGDARGPLAGSLGREMMMAP